MNKVVSWALFAFFATYLIVVGYIYINQHNIVLSPSPHYHPPPKSFNIVQKYLPFNDNDSLHVWQIKNNEKKRTILYFGGNAFNISHRLFHVDVFNQLGINAVMFDYKGYGPSTGSIKSKETFFESSALTYNYMVDSLSIPADSMIFWGYSLGAPIATELASGKEILGIILESPVISVNKISKETYPYLPFSMINKFDFNIYDHIDGSDSPLLLIHSTEDNVIPFQQVFNFFNDLNRENKKIIKIQGKHRMSSFDSFPKYYDGVSSFIKNSL